MAKEFLGKEVNAALTGRLLERVAALKERGISPKLALVRCGHDPSAVSYERAVAKRAQGVGVEVEHILLEEQSSREDLLAAISRVNEDKSVHGCLLFRPLPAHLRDAQDEICNTLVPEKDVDSMTALSCAGVFTGEKRGFPPCTPRACMEILDHYGISCSGKRAVVIGRSLVVGKPVAMMLLERNATVTICHTKTEDLPEITRQADILVSAAGALGSLTADHVRPGQVVLDVSVNWDEAKGGLAGDALYDQVAPVVEAITPVPGGVGGVTTSVLMDHVIRAAEDRCR